MATDTTEVDLEQYRGRRWEIERELGKQHAHDLLHKQFAGNAGAAADFLGFGGRSTVIRRWEALGLESLGRESPRRGRFANGYDFRQWPEKTLEEWDADYEALSQQKEKALAYDWDLPAGAATGLLVPIADLHSGHIGCDWSRFKLLVEWVSRRPRVRWFLAGDTLDTHCISSPGSSDEQYCPLDIAVALVEKHLKRIASQGICVFDGNHERRLRRAEDVRYSPARELANRLSLPFFAQLGGHIVHTVGEQVYKHFHHHGAGGARTDGAKLNRGEATAAIVRSHFVTMGHLHFETTVKLVEREVNDRNEVENVIKHLCLLPSFHDYRGYPVDAALKPSALGVSGIELGAKRFDIRTNV